MNVTHYDPGLNPKAMLYFVDDETVENPPESRPGSLPNVGFKFLNWQNPEAKWYSFGVSVADLSGFPASGGGDFYRVLEEEITVSTLVMAAAAVKAES